MVGPALVARFTMKYISYDILIRYRKYDIHNLLALEVLDITAFTVLSMVALIVK
jgi:hypothetical protein